MTLASPTPESESPSPAADVVSATILGVAADLLADGGLDALQLREVAKRSRVSLSTVYKHFGSRDALIIAAVEHWMDAHVYSTLPVPVAGEVLSDTLVRFFRHFLKPWTDNPTMLSVYLAAAHLPGGGDISEHGARAVSPMADAMFAGHDRGFVEDIGTVLALLTEGLLARFATGRADLAEIGRVYEVAVHRLTAGTDGRR